ncbi:ADP-ribosylglycohydrolase family protein [Caldimonas tepidiphila]|uniref:ADP-ribosylglycohydrolase family protein n=1 Tax=Caldimonas tepidiphila TaxID=2315841 RepID=UPI000E5C4F4E|nr:ADP-ribosylglycohydrolase family protein [Caldimonas tepidiphila]
MTFFDEPPALRDEPRERRRPPSERSRLRGCLLGGAVGDALGAPVECLRRTQILDRFGPQGITRHAPAYGGLGRITDDTQMTLFTAEGLLRAWVRGHLEGLSCHEALTAHAYLRWLATQGVRPAEPGLLNLGVHHAGWLYRQRELHQRRAPGSTCLRALQATDWLGEPARNDSKGCGGVTRMAPVGLFLWRQGEGSYPDDAFQLGARLAALTHGHPTGSLAAGALAVLMLQLADGASLPQAIAAAKTCLRTRPAHEETLQAIVQAQALAASGLPHEQAIARLGEGWVAEEALAISIYCALVARDFRHRVVLAVNHDGNSSSTGSITGNLLGTRRGAEAIPPGWLEPLELREVIAELAEDLYAFADWDLGERPADPSAAERIWRKYPGL